MLETAVILEWHKDWRRQVVEAFVNCRDCDMGGHVDVPLSDWQVLEKAIMQAPSRTLPLAETIQEIMERKGNG